MEKTVTWQGVKQGRTLDEVVQENLMEKLTFKLCQSCKGLGKSILNWGKSKCKGPQPMWVCLGKQQEGQWESTQSPIVIQADSCSPLSLSYELGCHSRGRGWPQEDFKCRIGMIQFTIVESPTGVWWVHFLGKKEQHY